MKKTLILITILCLALTGNSWAQDLGRWSTEGVGGVITKTFTIELDSITHGDTDYARVYAIPVSVEEFIFIDDSATGSGATPDSNVWISLNYAFTGVVVDQDTAQRSKPNCLIKAFFSSIPNVPLQSSGFATQRIGQGPISAVFFADTATATFSVTVDDSSALDQDGRLNTRLVDDNVVFGVPHYLMLRLTPTWTAGEINRKMIIQGVVQGIDRRRFKS